VLRMRNGIVSTDVGGGEGCCCGEALREMGRGGPGTMHVGRMVTCMVGEVASDREPLFSYNLAVPNCCL
jgi:hypothetical protein